MGGPSADWSESGIRFTGEVFGSAECDSGTGTVSIDFLEQAGCKGAMAASLSLSLLGRLLDLGFQPFPQAKPVLRSAWV